MVQYVRFEGTCVQQPGIRVDIKVGSARSFQVRVFLRLHDTIHFF